MHPDRMTETDEATTDLTVDELAERSGVEPAYIARLVEVGILQTPKDGSGFRPTDPRRVRIIKSLDESGLSLDRIGEAFRCGALSLEFVEQPSYHRFSSSSDETFEEIALRTGIPLEVVLTIRESTGALAIHASVAIQAATWNGAQAAGVNGRLSRSPAPPWQRRSRAAEPLP
jgi:DNA-binding transcriptional MerR regulator